MEMYQPQQHISPKASPERQANNQDPFAAFAMEPASAAPTNNMTSPSQPAVPPQPPQQQQQQDPWANMMSVAPPAQVSAAPMAAPAPNNPAPVQTQQVNNYVAPPMMQQMPSYTAPAPVQQPIYTAPSVAQITPPAPQQPVMQMPTAQPPATPMQTRMPSAAVPQAPAQQQPTASVQPPVAATNNAAVPPMPEVYADPQNQEPDSPIGDVSAILQQEPVQPAQPAPQMPMMFPVSEGAPDTMQQPAVGQMMQMNPAMQQQQQQQQAVAPTQMPPMQQTPAPMQMPTMQQQAVPSASPMQQPNQAPQAEANPFDFGNVASAMPTVASPNADPAPSTTVMPTNPPLSPPRNDTNPNNTTAPFSPPMSPVNAPTPQANIDPFGYCFSPMSSPTSNAIVPSAAPVEDPFGVFGGQQPPAMPSVSGNNAAPSPSQVASPTQAMVPSTAVNNDPFGVFGGQQQQQTPQPTSADPFGMASPAVAPAPAAPAALDDDPFGVFSAPAPTPAPVAQPAQPAPAAVAAAQDEDPWVAAGFGARPGTTPVAPSTPTRQAAPMDNAPVNEAPVSLDSNGLPSDGEYYEARVGARSLGVMFYTARELKDSLLQNVPRNVIEGMGVRPIVAYVAKNSAAYNSGIHLGHTILEVNGQPVHDAEHCAELVRVLPRPLNVRCFNPNVEVAISENRHLVKYDTIDIEAPKSSNEWKMKYVVVGGIIAKDSTVNMFYNKSDYDIAVKETHTRQKISVKIKQFDLTGAKIILRSKDGRPNTVNYPGEPTPWHYFTILPRRGYPIKISSPTLEDLEPVYRAVRSFIQKDLDEKNAHARQMGHYVREESVFQTVQETPPRGAGRARSTKDSYW